MADFYSEHYAATSSATVTPPASLADPRIYAAPGRGMAKVFRKHCLMDFTVQSFTSAAADTIHCFPMKSGDRIIDMKLQTDASFVDTGTLLLDVGLHAYNDTLTGAALDVNLFAAAVDIDATANEDTDAFLESTSLSGFDRGKALWELLAITDGTDTVDPIVLYDVTMTITSGTDVTAGGLLGLQVEFLAAGTN